MIHNTFISFDEFLNKNQMRIPLPYQKFKKVLKSEERQHFMNKNRAVSAVYNSKGYLKTNFHIPICKLDIRDEQ
jgi:hypothetical protein